MAAAATTTAASGSSSAAAGFGIMAGYQVISGFVQADAVRKQADIQRQIAEFNAELAEYDAWKVQGFGQTMIARYQSQIDQVRGSTKVAAAIQGVDTKEGSASEIVAQNELTGYFNKLDMDNRTYEQAMGYKRQASSIRLGSQLNGIQSRTQANSLIAAGVTKGATTYLGSKIQQNNGETRNLPQGDISGYGTANKLNYNFGDSMNQGGWAISLMPGNE